MRKTILIIGLLIGVAASLYALPLGVRASGGDAILVYNGNDPLFVFNGSIDVSSIMGPVDWYCIETGQVDKNIEHQYNMDEGSYYIIKNGVAYDPFYVFRLKPNDLTMRVETGCDNTTLSLTGDTKGYHYTRPDGTTGVLTRSCTIDYNALSWSGEQWTDSAASQTETLAGTIFLPPLYGPTPVTVRYDEDLRERLHLTAALVSDTLPLDSIRAVKHEVTSLATTRGTEGEDSNERNRPTSQDLITGSEYSGALEVAFYSNPTPAVQFVHWSIYHSTERIATRSDQDIRYVFTDPGSYRVVCAVNNGTCTSDSTEVTVAIAESYLAVPNVFTPNGDGVNDEFRVAYRSLREFHCWVYNRWGKLVYQWTDPAQGWDGTINGRPAAEGAYFYVIRAFGTDAAADAKYVGAKASYTKRKLNADEALIGVYQLSGDINLLRGKQK